MLSGLLDEGLPEEKVWVIEPKPSKWLLSTKVRINQELPPKADIVLIAVKPQAMGTALPQIINLVNGTTTFLSVAAGISLDFYARVLGDKTKIVRAMPNTPAVIGKGITAIIANQSCKISDIELCDCLLSTLGKIVRLEKEEQMNVVTGLSGSGPAYLFYLIEAMASAGEDLGLSSELAMHLAKETVAGASALAIQNTEQPEQLRKNVTSPNGTTEAGLEVLMDKEKGLAPLIRETIVAASRRSEELSNG